MHYFFHIDIIPIPNINNNEISKLNLQLYMKDLKLFGGNFKSIGQNEEHGNFMQVLARAPR